MFFSVLKLKKILIFYFNLVCLFSEVAFILSDPFVVDMLARNSMSFLNRCVQNELLPRVKKFNFKFWQFLKN